MRQPISVLQAPRGQWQLAMAAVVLLSGCGPRRVAEMSGPAQFSGQIREILDSDRSTPEYYEALSRLDAMGPELDAILVQLARDPSANTTARANALIFLADRNSPAALGALRRAILTEEIPRLRSAAVVGLSRLADTSQAAASMLKTAVTDPARSVRLNALQGLDIREVGTLRSVARLDRDREVRAIALQLVAIAESRGAPLDYDRRGALRTAGTDRDPVIVFRPVRIESVAGYATGDLRIELPNNSDIPLSQAAEVVGRVVPAFFSPDRSHVVFEGDREIRVVDLSAREIISLGPGIAPRPVPFTQDFVFLREHEDGRTEIDDGTRIHYWVYRSTFSAEPPELVGEMTATLRPGVRGNYSPARWAVVGETPEGFVLRGEGISPFPLPAPIWGAGPDQPAPSFFDPRDIFRGWR
jgi:hypothetical protein